MQNEKIARRYRVTGIVQGVGYRYFARRVAETLGIAGWVRNLSDGSVEVYAIGNEEMLVRFESALRRGPHHATVHELLAEDASVDAAVTFFSVLF